jgi:hypothetical protein
MWRIDAVDPTAAGVTPAERVEVEPGDVVVGHPGPQSTAAGRTGDRGAVTVANGDRSLRLGIGGVDHRAAFAFRGWRRRDGVRDAVA